MGQPSIDSSERSLNSFATQRNTLLSFNQSRCYRVERFSGPKALSKPLFLLCKINGANKWKNRWRENLFECFFLAESEREQISFWGTVKRRERRDKKKWIKRTLVDSLFRRFGELTRSDAKNWSEEEEEARKRLSKEENLCL